MINSSFHKFQKIHSELAENKDPFRNVTIFFHIRAQHGAPPPFAIVPNETKFPNRIYQSSHTYDIRTGVLGEHKPNRFQHKHAKFNRVVRFCD